MMDDELRQQREDIDRLTTVQTLRELTYVPIEPEPLMATALYRGLVGLATRTPDGPCWCACAVDGAVTGTHATACEQAREIARGYERTHPAARRRC